MRLITWNVNGIRAAQKKGFLDYLKRENPDVMCLQETKASPEQLDEALLAVDGYESHFVSAEKKGYSGVAIYTRPKPQHDERLRCDALRLRRPCHLGGLWGFCAV